MVYGLGCRMKFKRLNKLCIINEEAVKKSAKIWICDLILKCHELSVHLLNITSADRQEVLHIELSLTALSCTLYAHLHRTVKHCHFTLNLYEIKCLKLLYPHGIRLPYLSVQGTCLIL